MELFYNILDKEDGLLTTTHYISRIYYFTKNKIKDPINKIKAETYCGLPLWLWTDGDENKCKVISLYNSLSEEDQRKVDMTVRDLVDHYKVLDMIDTENPTDDVIPVIDKVLKDYIEFRTSLDNVTPEDSEEIEKILEMSDEEYDAYQKAKDAELEAQFKEASKGDTGDISGDEESN